MLACLGAIVAELDNAAIVSDAGRNAPTDVNVRIVDRSVYCRAFAYTELGNVVGKSAVGRRTPVDAKICCGVASVIVRTVERIDAGPISSAAVG